MSTTDRAFIKAFQRGRSRACRSAQAPVGQMGQGPACDMQAAVPPEPGGEDALASGPVRPEAASPADAGTPHDATVAHSAAGPQSRPHGAAGAPRDRAGEPDKRTRAPHDAVAAPATDDAGESVGPAASDGPAKVYARHDAGPTPPAPHFNADPHRTSAAQPLSHFASHRPPDDGFQPAGQVDAFAWPEPCRRLVDQMADDWDTVVSRLLQPRGDAAGQIVGVAGCRRQAGCSTILLCLAHRLSQLGVPLAMVDAHFEHPDLARLLGVTVATGWDDVLRAGMPLSQAIVQSASDRAALLPIRGPMGAAQQQARCLPASLGLRVVRRHYRMTLVDLGPLLDAPDPPLALGLVEHAGIDRVLLVHDTRQPHAVDRLQAAARLRQAGVTVIGVTETFAPCGVGGLAAPLSTA